VATARKRRQSHGLGGDLLRLLAGAGLLAAVVLITVNGVNSAGSEVEQGRLNDRVGLSNALARPLGDWLSGARAAASAVASGTPPSQLPSWDALRVDLSDAFVGLSGRYLHLSGTAQSHPCSTGAGLRDLVDAAHRASAPVALVVNPPGACDAVIGAAAPTAGGVAVVTSDIGPLLAHVAVASHFESGIRTIVIDPAGATVSPDSAVRVVPPYLVPFASHVAKGAPGSTRQATSDRQRPTVVDAGAPVGGGWAVVVEQNAANFDVGRVVGPSKKVVVMVGVLFAIILLLQALSDARRRGAARLADAHTAAFLARLSHELRTPLTVIKGFITTLAGRWDALSEEQRHDLVDRLPPQSRRLNFLVDKLLLATNMQAGALPKVTLEPVEVERALERIAESYTPVAPLHEFVVDAPHDAIVRADEKVLGQILDQLVDNAVKYSPEGGVVRLSARRARSRVEIVVDDEGVGLPRDLEAIFDAFSQGEEVDGRVHDEGGVGVGLYIVRTLSEQLGGSVRAERRARGARFVVTLRACQVRILARV
jgi:signal transduction histidine kinase